MRDVVEQGGIAFRGLSIGYGRQTVARDLEAQLSGGELILLTGPNGSGKTTLLRTLIGLQRPLAGRVIRGGDRVVGYVPQLGAFDPGFPIAVGEVVAMGLTRRPRSPSTRVLEALAQVGLDARIRHPFFALSGGQRQRVLVARALVADAEILALDEPTAGVDEQSAKDLWRLLRATAFDGRLVLVATHDVDAARPFAHRMFRLEDGALSERPRA
jgi:zinc/manganese transport system ATP-binding protein